MISGRVPTSTAIFTKGARLAALGVGQERPHLSGR